MIPGVFIQPDSPSLLFTLAAIVNWQVGLALFFNALRRLKNG